MSRLPEVPRNLSAFLDMIAHSEGTATIAGSDDGYNVIVGGALFQGYADHPRKLVRLRPGLVSTAAGRYQVLAHYFDAYKRLLCLSEFSPCSQDRIALQQIKEAGALALIQAGDFPGAVTRCAHLWASLPGADYGQHENKLADLEAVYRAAGGTVAA